MSAPKPPDPAASGRRLPRFGEYQVVKHIATGGMGAVYKAVHSKSGREVAIKVLSDQLAAKPALLKRFKREAKNGLRLNHENVVRLYDFGDQNGMNYLVMEYVQGMDLHEYLQRKKRLSVKEARAIIVQAVKALDHLHRHGITHRDIKPSNFIITARQGKPLIKLIDLGLARQTRDSDEESRVTRDGSTLGTVDYMAPEQAKDAGLADIRSDIYSLGCSWYQLLAGRAPFAEGNITERIFKHVNTPPPDLRDVNPDVPPEDWEILQRMLAKRQEDRYQTPAELLRDLLGKGPRRAPIQSDVLEQLASGAAEDDSEKVRVAEIDESDSVEQAAAGDWNEDDWDGGAEAAEGTGDRLWLLIGVAAAVAVVLIGLLIWVVVHARQ